MWVVETRLPESRKETGYCDAAATQAFLGITIGPTSGRQSRPEKLSQVSVPKSSRKRRDGDGLKFTLTSNRT